ncbi:MAG: hypothetical protein ACI9WU_003368 [Myxococcota bacterium]|jgi:hypothetical protein
MSRTVKVVAAVCLCVSGCGSESALLTPEQFAAAAISDAGQSAEDLEFAPNETANPVISDALSEPPDVGTEDSAIAADSTVPPVCMKTCASELLPEGLWEAEGWQLQGSSFIVSNQLSVGTGQATLPAARWLGAFELEVDVAVAPMLDGGRFDIGVAALVGDALALTVALVVSQKAGVARVQLEVTNSAGKTTATEGIIIDLPCTLSVTLIRKCDSFRLADLKQVLPEQTLQVPGLVEHYAIRSTATHGPGQGQVFWLWLRTPCQGGRDRSLRLPA